MFTHSYLSQYSDIVRIVGFILLIRYLIEAEELLRKVLIACASTSFIKYLSKKNPCAVKPKTMSLVNVSLKFQTLISEIRQY